MSASFACVSCRSDSFWPNIDRVVARARPSASARRAKPSAAAATEVRNTSSVRIASLKPAPASARHCDAGMRQPSNARRASGCGAIVSRRSAMRRPGVSASTTKAAMDFVPRVSGAAPGSTWRANTT